MDKKKKIIIVAVILAITAAVLVYAFTRPEKNQAEQSNNEQVEETKAPEEDSESYVTQPETEKPEEVKVPEFSGDCTVIYIYSEKDADRDKNLEMVEKLKNDYAEKAEFNVMELNDEFVKMTGFAIEGETPKVIIMPNNGGTSTILPNCTDEAEIRQAIDKSSN